MSGAKRSEAELSKVRKCWILFSVFFKIAALVVGGGYAIVPAAESEFIRKHKLLTEEELLDMMAVIQSLPGIIAGNAALYMGFRAAGIWGALAALLGVAMPSVIVILLIAIFLRGANLAHPLIQGAFLGAQAAITGLVALTAVRMARKVLHSAFAIGLAAAGVIATIFFKVSPVWVILSGAFLGISAQYVAAFRAMRRARK